jgi:hypothetical protein
VKQLRQHVQKIEPGRLGVFLAVMLAVGMFVAELDRGPFEAFWRAAVSSLFLLLLVGVGAAIWRGKDMKSAQAGPLAVEFEEKTQTALSTINERLHDQMRDTNERFHEIERRLGRIEDRQEGVSSEQSA